MLHNIPKVYFYGEFGCLNYSILGHLEEMQPSFLICTQPDYFKLMKMKSGKIRYDVDRGIYRAKCKGSGFGLTIKEPIIEEIQNEGFISLHQLLKFKMNRCIKYLKPIKNPLTHDIGLKDKKYISISFRDRSHEPQRNLADDKWVKVLQTIRKHSDLPIIAHGMDIDTKEFEGIKKVESIEESIAYLNNSVVFIASMSGIAQFASNCNCGIIQIGDPSRHIEYDPFNKGAIAVKPNNFESAFLDFIK